MSEETKQPYVPVTSPRGILNQLISDYAGSTMLFDIPLTLSIGMEKLIAHTIAFYEDEMRKARGSHE